MKYIQNGLVALGAFIALCFKVDALLIIILSFLFWSFDKTSNN